MVLTQNKKCYLYTQYKNKNIYTYNATIDKQNKQIKTKNILWGNVDTV